MSSTTTKHNYHKYKDDNQLHQWYKEAQTKLLKKMTENVNKRIIDTTTATNNSIQRTIQNTTSNHIWSALFSNKSIQQYTDLFPLFQVSETLKNNALNQLRKNVTHWAGVEVHSMNKRPTDFKQYYKRADNWWNRYKAQWIGTLVIKPLLDEIQQYIVSVTTNFTITSRNKSVTEQMEQSLTRDILLFTVINELLYTEVEFARSKAQPLVMDQSFEKSEILKQWFEGCGAKYSTEIFNANWSIPPNQKKAKNNRSQNRFHIRDYARKWTDKLLKYKQHKYDTLIMQKVAIIQPIKPPSPKDMNNYNVPPSIEYDVPIVHSTEFQPVHSNKYAGNLLYAKGLIPGNNDGMPPPPYVIGNKISQPQPQIQPHHLRYSYMKTDVEIPVHNVQLIHDDDAQTGSTYSTISTYTRKPYRPFRRRGRSVASYQPNYANINTIRPTSRCRYNPMKYSHIRRCNYSMRYSYNPNVSNVSYFNDTPISMPAAPVMELNESVINMNNIMANNIINTDMNNDISLSTVSASIEENYPPMFVDADDDTELNFNEDNIYYNL